MKKIREKVFETNSSSTHTLSIVNNTLESYLPKGNTLIVRFLDTDKETVLTTLKDKVSYLVSQIVNQYKWDCLDYEELRTEVERDEDFQRIVTYVKNKFGKEVKLPYTYEIEDGCLDEIVNINHQIVGITLNEVLEDLICPEHDLLDDVLKNNVCIEFGRD